MVHHRVRNRHRKRCDGDSARGRLFGFQALEKITARLDEFEPSRMGVKFGTQVVVFADKKRLLLEGFEPFSLVGLHDEVDSIPVQGGIDSFRNFRPAAACFAGLSGREVSGSQHGFWLWEIPLETARWAGPV